MATAQESGGTPVPITDDKTPAKTGLYKGWGIVAAGFVLFFFSYAAASTFPFIYGPVMDEFGWTRTQATLIYTYQSGIGAFIALFVIGPVIEKFGLKAVQFCTLTFVGTGMALFVTVDSLWTYYLAGLMIGMGQGTTLVTIKLLVSRWFMRNVGLAGAIAIAGSSLGGIVFPQYVTLMIPEWGWRLTFASQAIGVILVCLPLCLFLNSSPTEKDVLPESLPDRGTNLSPEQLRAADLDMEFRDVLRQPMFYSIMCGIILIAMVDQGIFQHTVLFLTKEAGLDMTLVAGAVSLTFIIGFAAKFIAGRFFDVTSMKGIGWWYIAVAVSTLLAFPVQGMITLMVFASARGLVHGGLVSESPVIAKHVYGPRLMTRVLPLINGFWAIGSSLGPVTLAMLADWTGSYKTGFIVFTALSVVAAFLIWQGRPLYRDRLRAAALAA